MRQTQSRPPPRPFPEHANLLTKLSIHLVLRLIPQPGLARLKFGQVELASILLQRASCVADLLPGGTKPWRSISRLSSSLRVSPIAIHRMGGQSARPLERVATGQGCQGTKARGSSISTSCRNDWLELVLTCLFPSQTARWFVSGVQAHYKRPALPPHLFGMDTAGIETATLFFPPSSPKKRAHSVARVFCAETSNATPEFINCRGNDRLMAR